MKTYGYATENDQGNFEVFWTEESTIFTKLFKRPTKFCYWSTSSKLQKQLHKSSCAGLSYEWFDVAGNKVTCVKTLDKISEVVLNTNLNEIGHTW